MLETTWRTVMTSILDSCSASRSSSGSSAGGAVMYPILTVTSCMSSSSYQLRQPLRLPIALVTRGDAQSR